MSTLYIQDYNPTLFLLALEEAILDGYYADNSVDGYPFLAAPNAITVKQTDKPEQRNDLSSSRSVVIQGYDNTTFILDVQDAILQGFYVDGLTVDFGAPHTVTLHKAVQGTLDVTPVRQDTQEAPDASQSATEAPKGKQTRKAKSKEI